MDTKFTKLSLPNKGTVIFPLFEGDGLSGNAAELDEKSGGAISKAIKSRAYKAKKGTLLTIYPSADVSVDTILLAGLGKSADVTEYSLQCLGGAIAAQLNQLRVKSATLVAENADTASLSTADAVAHIAYGASLRNYHFHKYFTKRKDEDKPSFTQLTAALDSSDKSSTLFSRLEKVAEGVFCTRDLVSEPPNVLHPENYAAQCKELKKLGVKVEVLGEKEMRKLGMGALLGVGQGSVFESKLVVMQWNGAPKGKAQTPVAFVGKGVTFDTGGISIKPSGGMEDMKYDMAGSGAVVGLIKALAGRKAKINAVGVVGLVENMPGGNAQRPSDVVTSMSGQTIEVLNTDAEGRLVLADALWYTQNRFKPRFMVNLATLTGAIVIALASEYAGLFSNNDELSERLTQAGEKVNEKLWRFPLHKNYNKMIDSKIADMQNIGNERGAGSITAAEFLQRFVNDVPWAHLDIAGVAWTKKNQDITPEGATGYGVRLLDRLITDYYE